MGNGLVILALKAKRCDATRCRNHREPKCPTLLQGHDLFTAIAAAKELHQLHQKLTPGRQRLRFEQRLF